MASTMTPVSGSAEEITAFRQGVSISSMSQLMSGMMPKFSSGARPKRVLEGAHCVESNTCFDDSLVTPTIRALDPLTTLSGSISFVSGSEVWVGAMSTVPMTDAGSRLTLVPNHETERRDFGQPKLFRDDEPFEDFRKFDPVHYIQDDNSTLMYPLILANASMKDPDQYDGVIEPLTIRSRASRLSPEQEPDFAHDVRALLLSDSGECSRVKANPIVQYIDFEDTKFDWYEDGLENFGAILMTDDGPKVGPMHPGYLTLNESVINPFVESTDWEDLRKELNHSSPAGEDPGGMNMALHNMAMSELELSSGITVAVRPHSNNDRLPRHHKSSGAGFTYDNNMLGTDSLAFGGLLKW